ncbi:MAG: aldehyde dehydrogenase family protein [Candidatus Dormibacteria bacterium]
MVATSGASSRGSGVAAPLLSGGLLIDGVEVEGHDAPLELLNPASGEQLAVVQCADAADVAQAVLSAKRSFADGSWSRLPIHQRARVLSRFADGLEARLEGLYQLEAANNGRPVTETRAQVARLPEWYRYNAALLLADRSSVVPMPGPYHSYTQRFPIGVAAILASFNHPLMIASKSLAPALATGNSVVLKPSERTPLTALELGRAGQEAGIPPGVLNVIPGRGPVAGSALVAHPEVGKVTFTGGSEAGRQVALAAAAHFARCTLELGGKTPVLVFADSELEAAARGCAFAAFIGAGQTCIAGSHFLVQDSVYQEFLSAFAGAASGIRLGDPLDPATQMGPLIAEDALRRVSGYVELGLHEGARLVLGGRPAAPPGLERGFFFEPTILADCVPSMRVVREEIFGPVAVVTPFSSEAEAVAMANASPFGLGSGIWTSNVARAHRVAAQLEFGLVWVNDHHRLDPSSPWGGLRASGMGKEGGWESFHDFCHERAVTVRLAPESVDWYGGGTGRLN